VVRLQGSLARRHSRGKLRQTVRLVEPVLRYAAALRGHRQFPRDGIPYPDFRILTGFAPFDRVLPGFWSTSRKPSSKAEASSHRKDGRFSLAAILPDVVAYLRTETAKSRCEHQETGEGNSRSQGYHVGLLVKVRYLHCHYQSQLL
jgi:hypothetical protein